MDSITHNLCDLKMLDIKFHTIERLEDKAGTRVHIHVTLLLHIIVIIIILFYYYRLLTFSS